MEFVVDTLRDIVSVADAPGIPWRTIVLGALTLQYVVEMYVVWRQAQMYRNTSIPTALAPFLNAADFSARQRASQTQVRMQMVHKTARYALDVVRVAFFVYAYAWKWGDALLDRLHWSHTELKVSLMYAVVLALMLFPLEPVMEAYEKYTIKRHDTPGMPQWRSYLTTYMSMVPFALLLGILLTSVCVSLARLVGDALPLCILMVGWVGSTISQFMWPQLIRPLVDQPYVLTSGTLYDRVHAVAQKVQFPLEHVFFVENSSQLHQSCVYLVGLGTKTKCVVLRDKLAAEDEMEALLVRELGHWALRHTRVLTAVSFVDHMLKVLLVALLIQNASLFRDFGFDVVAEAAVRPAAHAVVSVPYMPLLVGWHLCSLLRKPICALVQFGLNLYVHHMELAADRYAAMMQRPSATRAEEGAREALRKQEDVAKLDETSRDWATKLCAWPAPKTSEAYAPLLARAIVTLEIQKYVYNGRRANERVLTFFFFLHSLLFASAHDDALYSAYYYARPTPSQRLVALQQLRHKSE